MRWSAAEHDRILLVVLDACALICGEGKDFRCEAAMDQNFRDQPTLIQDQLSWLDHILNQPARWKIVVAHWPIFSFMGNGPSAVLDELLVPRLIRYNVQAYFSGHDHSLQHVRLRSSRKIGGPDFFVSGGGGYRLHPELKSDADTKPNKKAKSVFAASTFGFAAVELSRESLILRFIAVNGSEIYSMSRAS